MFIHGHHRDNYINAVYVQGFKKPDAFIATEAPLPARRSLFWHMVVQKQSQTIVVMNDLEPQDVSDGANSLSLPNLEITSKAWNDKKGWWARNTKEFAFCNTLYYSFGYQRNCCTVSLLSSGARQTAGTRTNRGSG